MPAKCCAFKACTQLVAYRGLCSKHYGQAKKIVDAGKTTWEELSHLGMTDEAENDFEAEFNKRARGTERKEQQ